MKDLKNSIRHKLLQQLPGETGGQRSVRHKKHHIVLQLYGEKETDLTLYLILNTIKTNCY